MIVTEVRKKGNNVIVNCDNDEKLIIPYELFVHNFISKNDELTEERKNYLEKTIELFKIKQSSFRYLSGRNHSRFEIFLKLFKKNYNKDYINLILNELEEKNYLDDKEFAKNYVKNQIDRKRGLLKIKADLYKKGVSREIIDDVMVTFADKTIFLESALEIAVKKKNQLEKRNIDKIKTKQKIFQYLSGRGYSLDIISEVIKNLNFEGNNE